LDVFSSIAFSRPTTPSSKPGNDKKEESALVDDLIDRYGIHNVLDMVDKIKAFGFKYATYSGTPGDLMIFRRPRGKGAVIDAAKAKALQVKDQFDEGLLSHDERLRKIIEIWHRSKE